MLWHAFDVFILFHTPYYIKLLQNVNHFKCYIYYSFKHNYSSQSLRRLHMPSL